VFYEHGSCHSACCDGIVGTNRKATKRAENIQKYAKMALHPQKTAISAQTISYQPVALVFQPSAAPQHQKERFNLL
jgi:hypothetical protein